MIMQIETYIDALISYAMNCGLAQPEDHQVLLNRLLDIVQLDTYTPSQDTQPEELEEIYDEEGHFHQELAAEILRTALQQSLSQDADRIHRDVTVKLVNRDGAWWVVPDQALLQAISGLT